MKISSYPQIYNYGHGALQPLVYAPVYVEEKVDGSQFSFGVDEEGTLVMRSKRVEVYPNSPESNFKKAVDYICELYDRKMLVPNVVYRGEVLQNPRHNTIKYDRVPKHNIIIFDVESFHPGNNLSYEEKRLYAENLDLETVPLLYEGVIKDEAQFKEFLKLDSCLGGSKIEGVVTKPVGYKIFDVSSKALMGKFVSEAFKESNKQNWKVEKSGGKDIIESFIEVYNNKVRWEKAFYHLRDEGGISLEPTDIPNLIKEVHEDAQKEEEEVIKELLWQWAWPKIRKGITRGLPEWYKNLLLEIAFQEQNKNEL